MNLPQYPYLQLVYIFTATGYAPEPKGFDEPIKNAPGKILRYLRRQLPGRPRKGREICLASKNPKTGGKEYDCLLSLDGEKRMDQPEIYLSMRTGGAADGFPVLDKDSHTMRFHYNVPEIFSDDEEALGLWDALVNSIRPRPGAV